MKIDNLDKWLSIAANLGVIAGIIFLAFEIRLNTESNTIGIQEAFATNWVEMNTALATTEFSEVWLKARNGETLTDLDRVQLSFIARMYISQANLIRRLYERGIASEADLREGYRGIRSIAAEIEPFRETISAMRDAGTVVGGNIILEENGLEEYILNSR